MSAVYKAVVSVGDKIVPQSLLPLWQHPAGPKTVFFWAPLFKWSLVIAGIGDLSRPADKLSISQSSALAATGLIWARYSLVIIPKNYSLCCVNFFVFATSCYQLSRAFAYQQSLKHVENSLTESVSSTAAATVSENINVTESSKSAS